MIAIGDARVICSPNRRRPLTAHLLGRYMSLYGLSFTAGVALGPAVGGVLLQRPPTPSGGAAPWR